MHSPATSSVRGKEALPVIPFQISSWTGGKRQLCRAGGCTGRMNGQVLPSQLLLLVLTVAPALDARVGTTATPPSTNCSLKEGVDTPVLDNEVEFCKEIMMHLMDSQAFTDAIAMNYSIHARKCWDRFVQKMANISSMRWCEWNVISSPYSGLTDCLETWADRMKYRYPNTLAENYIVRVHRMYFLNCTLEHPLLLDPPENVLLTLIITPICLIPFLVTLVVLKSKDGKMQA